MRLVPRSLAGRMALASAILILIAVVAAGAGTAFTVQRFVRGQIDQRLDTQIAGVAAALSIADSALSLGRWTEAPPFDRPRSGWYWQASSGESVISSASLAGRELGADDGKDPWVDEPHERDGPPGPPIYRRSRMVDIDGTPVLIVATAPTHALFRPSWDAMRPVAFTMLVLGVCLTVASILLLRAGLRPLGALRRQVEEVRAGRAGELPSDQPRELAALVAELNRLITQNAEGLQRARGHVANLGHALNTPLASLALALADSPRSEDAERLELVRRIQDRIRHHLGRARAAALGGAPNARTPLGSHVDDIAAALARIHADRSVTFRSNVPSDLLVACEAQDLDEMVGNLLDNAFKWTAATVEVTAARHDNMVAITIEDDGAGLPDDAAPEALMPGRRLDEDTPGTGFGLPITRELAELYGGELRLGRGRLGGLAARLILPAAL